MSLQDGWTALHFASQNGHLPVVVALLEAGAGYASRDGHGRTALDVATPACAAVLRDAGGVQMRVSVVEVSRFQTVCEEII